MEHTVRAPTAGKITRIGNTAVAESVVDDDELLIEIS
jgi:biotin carboxyl carrier protein